MPEPWANPRTRIAGAAAETTPAHFAGMQREVRAAEAGEYDENDYLRPETVAGVLASVLALPADGLICDLTLRPSGRG